MLLEELHTDHPVQLPHPQLLLTTERSTTIGYQRNTNKIFTTILSTLPTGSKWKNIVEDVKMDAFQGSDLHFSRSFRPAVQYNVSENLAYEHFTVALWFQYGVSSLNVAGIFTIANDSHTT